MPRPIHACIHPAALRHNLALMQQRAAGARVWAVVKANAYGHGIERMFDALRGADGFALLDLAEAERVRRLGWRGPILLLEGVFEPRDLELCSRLQLWHVVHCDEQIDWLAMHKTRQPQRVFLKLNSGMNRLGFAPARYRAAYARLAALPQVEEISHMTHFAHADGPPGVAGQQALFERAVQGLPGERSLCNSAALLRHPEAHGDWVRPGIALYGSAPDWPERSAAHWGLQAAMSLRSRLIAITCAQPGQSVGYGGAYAVRQPTRVGIVACGYADGYPRHAPSGTPVLVAGQRTHTLGRISMDMLAVDVTHIPQAAIGSSVTLWGQGLPIDEVAHSAGTVGYELMSALAARVPVTVDEDEDEDSPRFA